MEKDDDLEQSWSEREAELTRLLGKPSDTHYHAPMPLYLGGDADVLVFPDYINGTTYVTSDLTGGIAGQLYNRVGEYELMICLREPADWAISLISKLARYTLENVINTGDTMDFPWFPESQISALLFAQPAELGSFKVSGIECTLLILIGITIEELHYCRDNGNDKLLERLKEAKVYPYTEIGRNSVNLS